jgi:hypothetical protein
MENKELMEVRRMVEGVEGCDGRDQIRGFGDFL